MASAKDEMKQTQALFEQLIGCTDRANLASDRAEQTVVRMEELLARLDEREQKMIGVENRLLYNMTALADLIGDPPDAPDETPGKESASAEERLRRNVDALEQAIHAPVSTTAETPTKEPK